MTTSRLIRPLRLITRQARTLIWPENCRLCHRPLNASEKYLCLHCLSKLPRTNFHRITENRVRQLVLPLAPKVFSANWLFYNRENQWHALIHDIKYHDCPGLARYLGREYASELISEGFFNTVKPDIILPVPLHWSRFLKRTYNQAEEIAQGVSDATGIAVGDNLVGVSRHRTQTRRGSESRILNVDNIFAVAGPERLNGLNIVIVDDVITTGATISSVAHTLADSGVRPSSLTLMSLGVTKLK